MTPSFSRPFLLGVRVVPEELQVGLAIPGERQDLVPDLAHLLLAFVGGPDGTGLHEAGRLHVQPGAEQAGVDAHHRLAGVRLRPDVAVARHAAFGLEQVGTPADAFGAPDLRQPVRALVGEVPFALPDLQHGRVGVVEVVDLCVVPRLQELEIDPLAGAVVGRRADVEGGTARGLHLVDDLLVGADAGVVERDAGLGLEGRLPAVGQVVGPHQDVQLTRRRRAPSG